MTVLLIFYSECHKPNFKMVSYSKKQLIVEAAEINKYKWVQMLIWNV